MDGKSEPWPFLPNLTILSPTFPPRSALRTLRLTTLRRVRARQPRRLLTWSGCLPGSGVREEASPRALRTSCVPFLGRTPGSDLMTKSKRSDSRRAVTSSAWNLVDLPASLRDSAGASGRGAGRRQKAEPRPPCWVAHGGATTNPWPRWVGLCVFLALRAGRQGYVSR